MCTTCYISRGRGRGRYGRGRGRNNNDAYACNANNDARLHEDVEEDLHLLMTQEIVFTVAKVVIMLGTVIKNKQIIRSGKLQHGNYASSSHDNCSEKLFAIQQKMHSTTTQDDMHDDVWYVDSCPALPYVNKL